jgi:hypothetical protein
MRPPPNACALVQGNRRRTGVCQSTRQTMIPIENARWHPKPVAPQPRPWRRIFPISLGRAGNRSAMGQESALASAQSSASFTRRRQASIFESPPRLRSHPASWSLAAKASCDSPAAVRSRRTCGPTRFCVAAAIAPLLELDDNRSNSDQCSVNGASRVGVGFDQPQ